MGLLLFTHIYSAVCCAVSGSFDCSKAIPLSSDLWISYLELYYQIYEQHDGFDTLFYQQCETAVQTVGLDYRSDIIWEK